MCSLDSQSSVYLGERSATNDTTWQNVSFNAFVDVQEGTHVIKIQWRVGFIGLGTAVAYLENTRRMIISV